MAPPAQWKGYSRLSLVSCPIALYPASSSGETIHFNQINKNTGHRIRMLKVDAQTGDPGAAQTREEREGRNHRRAAPRTKKRARVPLR
jgi:non-homologous end joining protein Ku